jgi:hypothetical protein
VRQQRFGVDVAFAAEYFVADDRELIEKITRLVPRLVRKLRQDRLQIRHLIRRHLEVGMQTDESPKLIHISMVNLSGMQGEVRRLRQKRGRPLTRRSPAKYQMFRRNAVPVPRWLTSSQTPFAVVLCSFAAFKKCLAQPEIYCQSHHRRRARKSFHGTIRASKTSVSASIAQAPSRDFLHSLIDPQPLAFRKRGLT